MDSIRIAILSANNTPVAFMDNAHKKSMHYWDDELHEYLQGAANTYTFTVNAKHPDAEHVTVGNKVAFTYKGRSYYLNIVNTDQTEKTITATAWSLSFELIVTPFAGVWIEIRRDFRIIGSIKSLPSRECGGICGGRAAGRCR